MGKLILCSGKSAKNPFHFELTNTNVYSIEELCYYIYHNIYAITEENFDISFIHWLKEEVELLELAAKLEKLITKHYGLKDVIVTILCGSDYFVEKEIKDLIAVIDEICHLPPIKRQKIKADHYLVYGKYRMAAKEYNNIIKDKEAAIFTEEELGNMKHNMAIIKIHTDSFIDAAEKFREAYMHNRKEESLKAYLFSLKLGKHQKEFEQAMVEYNIPPELMLEVNQEMEEKEKEAAGSLEYTKLLNLEKMKKDGKVNEYYKELNCFMEQWKQEYRQELLK